MVEPVETMDGWYCLHDLRQLDWALWKKLTSEERDLAIKEFQDLMADWQKIEDEKNGSQSLYKTIGHKADLMFMFLRPTVEELLELETAISKTILGDFLIPTFSYFSIVELAKYRPEKDGVDPASLPETQARLKPILPRWNFISFYPMSRRRMGEENWYTLSKADRGKLLYEHSMTGRKYAGKVQQIITGSIGLEKWEWGVTLFAHDALQLKKIVYEMRFDEVTAKYGEFDEFYIGSHLSEENFTSYLKV